MKYSKRIVHDICEELRKTPNIRYVCKKMGIDHSTFYRWMSHHFAFHQLSSAALLEGRELMNDSAEGVVISGIQKGDIKAAKYWLSHNDTRYSSQEQRGYMNHLNKITLELLKKPVPMSKESMFEKLFDLYEEMRTYDPPFKESEIKKELDKYLDFLFFDFPEVKNIFYATLEEWKNEKDSIKETRENLYKD